jgi:hypothetical protein
MIRTDSSISLVVWLVAVVVVLVVGFVHDQPLLVSPVGMETVVLGMAASGLLL